MNLGLAIRNIRKSRGLTIAAVAAKAGITSQTVKNAESGLQGPNKNSLKCIAKALNVTPAYIYLMAIDKDDFNFSKHKDAKIILTNVHNQLMTLSK